MAQTCPRCNPTTGDKYKTTWFTVVGPDIARPRAYVARRLVPEFAECAHRLDGEPAPDDGVTERVVSLGRG